MSSSNGRHDSTAGGKGSTKGVSLARVFLARQGLKDKNDPALWDEEARSRARGAILSMGARACLGGCGFLKLLFMVREHSLWYFYCYLLLAILVL